MLVRVEKRLDYILEQNGFWSLLLQAAELASAEGAVVFRLIWDRRISDCPIIDVVQAQQCIPEFRWGRLAKMWLWREVRTEEQGTQYRVVECHEPGRITTGLYRGSIQSMGEQLPLDAIKRIQNGAPRKGDLLEAAPLTDLADTAHLEPVIETGLPGLACWYICNRRPHPKWPYLYIGRSDYHAQESMFDSIDETWSSWMRDIRLGLSRIIAPESFFEHEEQTNRRVFNTMRESYLGLDALQQPGSGINDNITVAQFKIRADEHEKTLMNLLKHCYSTVGYSPHTFGIHDEGRAESGAALDIRERKSWTTNANKAQYWPAALAQMLYYALIVDRKHCGGPVEPMMPSVEMQDSMQSDFTQVSNVVETISRAGAASAEVKVRWLHPDWSDAQVLQEVDRIRAEYRIGGS